MVFKLEAIDICLHAHCLDSKHNNFQGDSATKMQAYKDALQSITNAMLIEDWLDAGRLRL